MADAGWRCSSRWTLGLQSQEPIEGAFGQLLSGLQRPGVLMKGLRSPSAVLLLLLATTQFVLQARRPAPTPPSSSHTRFFPLLTPPPPPLAQAWGRRFEEDFNNFHDFEHWPCASSPPPSNPG